MKRLTGILMLTAVMCLPCFAIKAMMFNSVDQYIERASGIWIVQAVKLVDQDGLRCACTPYEVQVLHTLKSEKNEEVLTVCPISRRLIPGDRYLVFGFGHTADNKVLIDNGNISPVPIPAWFSMKELEEKTLKQQISAILTARHKELEKLIKQYRDEKKALEEGYPRCVSLAPVDGVQLIWPQEEPYTGAGVIRVDDDTGKPVKLSAKNIGSTFGGITSTEKALAACQFLVWGTLVESETTFRRILDTYAAHGFAIEQAEEKPRAQCRVFDVARQFDCRVEETALGYRVEFTAFVLQSGMGAPASLARFCYTVGKDATVRKVKQVTYLEGPWLNWQTSELDAAGEKENERQYERIRQLIKAVYQECPSLLPPGR